MNNILLHCCCGPCATSCIETLIQKSYTPTLFFDNPNIYDEDERNKRRYFFEVVAKYYNLKTVITNTPHNKWLERIKGYERENEGGLRCSLCFNYNLELAYNMSKNLGIPLFTTSLSVSKYKDSSKIFKVGEKYQGFEKIDFKKNAGFERSCKLSKELNLYRQQFCGCEFSKL